MSTLTQFGGGNEIGTIVPGTYPGNSRFLPCDGVSTTAVTSTNASLAKIYPFVSTSSSQFVGSNYAAIRVYGIAYGNGLWVVVGSSSSAGTESEIAYCLTSQDLINWTPRPLPATRRWRSIVWNGSRFITIGTTIDDITTSVAYSVDGYTWVDGAFGASSSPMRYLATSGNRVWAIQTANGGAQYTEDGTSWTNGGTTNITGSTMLHGFKGRIYACNGSSVTIKYSGGSLTNTWVTGPTFSNIMGVASSPNTIVFVSGTANQTRTSTDGITFNLQTAPAMHGVVWNGSVFVGFGSGTVHSSPDGVTWTLRSTGNIFTSASQRWIGATDGTNIAAADTQNPVSYLSVTTDGTTFNQRVLPKSSFAHCGPNSAIAYSSSLGLYAMGGISETSWEIQPIVMTSPDGITWTERALETTSVGIGLNNSISQIVWGAGAFVATYSANNTLVATSTDGVNWRYKASTVTGSTGFITFGSGKFVFINSTGAYSTSTDGSTWTSQGSLGTGTFIGVAFNGTVFCAMTSAGGVFTSTTATGAWTSQTAQTGTFVQLGANGTSFIATISGASSTFLSSTTATGTWTTRNIPITLNSARISSDGATCALSSLASSNTQFASFTDPATVSLRTLPRLASSDNSATTLVANGTFFVHTNNSSIGQRCASSVFTSTNGTSWNERSLYASWNTMLTGLTNTSISSVIFAGKAYFATNYRPVIWSVEEANSSIRARVLPSGITNSGSTVFQSMATNGSLMVAIGYDSPNVRTVICTSSDGADWVLRTTPTLPTTVADGAPTVWTNLIWNGSQFLATSNSHIALTSPDGITWTVRYMPTSGVTFGSATWGAGSYFVGSAITVPANGASTFGFSNYFTSTDGITWTQRTTPVKYQSTNNGLYFGTNGTTVVMMPMMSGASSQGVFGWITTDGTNWTRVQANGYGAVAVTATPVIWTGSMFVMGTMGSTDGRHWFGLVNGSAAPFYSSGSTSLYFSSTTLNVSTVDFNTIKSPNLNSTSTNNAPFYQLSLIVG